MIQAVLFERYDQIAEESGEIINGLHHIVSKCKFHITFYHHVFCMIAKSYNSPM